MQSKDVCVLVANILAGLYRSVFHNNYLEVVELQSSLLTLGRVDASITLLSLTRSLLCLMR